MTDDEWDTPTERRLAAERDKLQRFKDWVHAYLDGKGVPHHPPGTHGAEGCRIGDRMDWVWARVAVLEAERDALVELARKLTNRCGQQAEILAARAEKAAALLAGPDAGR